VASTKSRILVLTGLRFDLDLGCSKGAMDSAAEKGYLDVVQWLHHNRNEE
jgi:hypothetical protein